MLIASLTPRSGKVHVVAKAILAGALEQDGKMGPFRLSRSAADQNDQAWLFLRLPGERQKVITVAADEDESLRTSIAKNLFAKIIAPRLTLWSPSRCANRSREFPARP